MRAREKERARGKENMVTERGRDRGGREREIDRARERETDYRECMCDTWRERDV